MRMRTIVRARRIAGARPPCLARRTRGTAAAAVLALGVAPAALAPPPAAARACAAAAASPGAAISTRTLRGSLRCLVNAERGARGLAPLHRSRRLARAATWHAADMVTRRYFAHERPGWTLPIRMQAVGWTGTVGEAIAWGCGGSGTPRAILDSWLQSPPHRAIVLGPYRRAGIGLAVGVPVALACSRAGTWVLDAGRRA